MKSLPAILMSLGVLALAQVPAPKPKPAGVAKPAVAAVKPAAAAKPKPAAASKPATASAAAPAAPAGPSVFTVGDERFTKDEFEGMLNSLPDQVKGQFSSPQGKREFARQLGEMKALAQEARRRGLHQDPKTKAQLRIQEDQTLASMLARDLTSKINIDETAARKYYDDNKNQFESVNGRHILIRFKGSRVPVKEGQRDLTEEESLAKAQEIRKRIQGGEDFAEVAKKESDDTGSGAAGGSLGDFGRGQMVPQFEQAAFSLPVGELSEPVKSPFGYHLIQIQGKKNQTFEEARAKIEQQQKPAMQRQAIDEVSKKTAVVLDEAYFGKQ